MKSGLFWKFKFKGQVCKSASYFTKNLCKCINFLFYSLLKIYRKPSYIQYIHSKALNKITSLESKENQIIMSLSVIPSHP